MTTPTTRPCLTICRLALDPATGRVRHPEHLGVALRAAIFAELIMANRLTGRRLPTAVGVPQTDDRLTDSLHRSLAAHRAQPWRRWFSHVRADVAAVTDELLRLGVWIPDSDGRFRDTAPDVVAAQANQVREVISRIQRIQPIQPIQQAPQAHAVETTDAVDAIVILLATGAGLGGARPRPRAALEQFDWLLPAADRSPAVELACDLETIRTAVRAALIAMRSRALFRFMSG